MSNSLRKLIRKEIKKALNEGRDPVLERIRGGGLWNDDTMHQVEQPMLENEIKDVGLIVSGNRSLDSSVLKHAFDEAGLEAYWNWDKEYWWFPADESDFEQLESSIESILKRFDINASIEGQTSSTLEEGVIQSLKKKANLLKG